MLKKERLRVIPSILIDGLNVVKGRNFVNSRVVGNVFATARLFGTRTIDELIILDVTAREFRNDPSYEIFTVFAKELTVPFTVGGSISSVSQALYVIRNGAERVVLGTTAYENPDLISKIASELGSQAVVVSVDIDDNFDGIFVRSGKQKILTNVTDYCLQAQNAGAGEILLQSVSRDGTLSGIDFSSVRKILDVVNVPVVVSGGVNSIDCFFNSFDFGASGVAAGAFFQFTEHTPLQVMQELRLGKYSF